MTAKNSDEKRDEAPSKLQRLKDQAQAKGKELLGDAKEGIKDWWNGPKWGQTHLGGMARQGLAELRAGFYPDSNIAQPTDYGVFGRATPGETADLRREETVARDANEEKTVSIEPQATAHGDTRSKTQEDVLQPREEKGTSWGNSKLEQKKHELSSRETMEPEREEREHER